MDMTEVNDPAIKRIVLEALKEKIFGPLIEKSEEHKAFDEEIARRDALIAQKCNDPTVSLTDAMDELIAGQEYGLTSFTPAFSEYRGDDYVLQGITQQAAKSVVELMSSFRRAYLDPENADDLADYSTWIRALNKAASHIVMQVLRPTSDLDKTWQQIGKLRGIELMRTLFVAKRSQAKDAELVSEIPRHIWEVTVRTQAGLVFGKGKALTEEDGQNMALTMKVAAGEEGSLYTSTIDRICSHDPAQPCILPTTTPAAETEDAAA